MSKSTADLAAAWSRKGDSDIENARLCLSAGKSLDTACFHCQQAAEKWLKAYLIASGTAFPFTHDLTRLIDLCAASDAGLGALRDVGASLNAYAVSTRYDEEFWPDASVVAEAIRAAEAVRLAVQGKLATSQKPKG
jgi:HEPN domain-containing protein